MTSQKITSLLLGSDSTDAATYGQLTSYVLKTGDTMTGALVNNKNLTDNNPNIKITNSNTNKILINGSAGVGNYNPIVLNGDKQIIYTDGSVDTGALVIAPHGNPNGPASGIRMDNSGNVGIGTALPGAKLQVAGSAIINNDLGVSGSATVGTGLSVSNGKITINESTGTPASATNGTLVLNHLNNGGTSSIVFPSRQNNNNDYGYIQYTDTVDAIGTEKSLLTIGVENDQSGNNEDSIKFRLNGADRVTISGEGDVNINGNLNLIGTSSLYPPAALTSNTTTLSGQAYGNGTYTASASSVANSIAFAAWKAFEKTSLGNWTSLNGVYGQFTGTSPNFYSTTYFGSASTKILNNPTSVPGEWLQIQLPIAINLTYLTLTCATDTTVANTPRAFLVVGSTHGSSAQDWTILYETNTTIGGSWALGEIKTVNTNSNAYAYNYFRIIIKSINYVAATSPLSPIYATIGEMVLYNDTGNTTMNGIKLGDFTNFWTPKSGTTYSLPSNSITSTSGNGYYVFPGNFCVQWGYLEDAATQTFNYLKTLIYVYNIQATRTSFTGSGSEAPGAPSVVSFTTTSCTINSVFGSADKSGLFVVVLGRI
jgi:hypothetical protein